MRGWELLRGYVTHPHVKVGELFPHISDPLRAISSHQNPGSTSFQVLFPSYLTHRDMDSGFISWL